MVNGWQALYRGRNLSRLIFRINLLQLYKCPYWLCIIPPVILAPNVLETTKGI